MKPAAEASASAGLTPLRGRRAECAALEELLAAVRDGESRSLVLRGDPGVGKSALLNYATQSADLRVLRATGSESESELAFAALHQLCAPMLDRLGQLPAPQRDALEVVFGLSAGPTPDRFLVGLAVLGLIADAAAHHGLLCIVDDSQWLDQGSAQTLGFVARRLQGESVGLVFATREFGGELRGLPELDMQGLRNGDARALLMSVIKFPLDERVSDRIVAETRGNPLALLELPRGLSPIQLGGGFGLLDAQALTGRIEDSFLRRLGALPEPTQTLLLVAAAESVGDPLLVSRAAAQLGVTVLATASGETDGLLEIGERVTFRHPLVRSAVYRAAAPQRRRAVHLALAEVTDSTTDPDRRAWHLAAAASGPDEAVAVELEQSAARAQARGGFSAAAAFLRRAVALTHDPKLQADRALAAALASFQAGAFDLALRLLSTAQDRELDELQAARVDLLRGQIAFASGLGGDAPPLLLAAASRLEAHDLDLARETYLNAWGAAAFAGSATAPAMRDVCRAVRALPASANPLRPVDLLLDGLTLLISESRTAAVSTLQQAARVFASEAVPLDVGLRWGWVATAGSNAMWDDDATRAICTRQIQIVRDAGALAQLPIYLVALGTAIVWGGDFSAAASLIAEADAVAAATGTRIAPYAAMLLLALRGRETEAAPLFDASIAQAADQGQEMAATHARWVAAILYNGLGQHDKALAAAQLASADPFPLFAAMWALPELVEAAVRSGRVDLAVVAIERLSETTRPAGTDFGLGIEARSRALVSDGERAEELYREAIERLGRTQLRPELARAHLLYGEWLRRQNRRTDARTQLRAADGMFATIGMEAFAARTRRELLATGATVRKRTVDAGRDELTPQEMQIALLVRDGLSNPEVGTRLFISPRTVEWHLRKIFAKLAIGSRRELRTVLHGTEYELFPG